MAKYRKKPVIVEAIQFVGSNYDEIRNFIGKDTLCSELSIVINTYKGDVVAQKGDYIIKGVRGEFYTCNPDVFKEIYEIYDHKKKKKLKNKKTKLKNKETKMNELMYDILKQKSPKEKKSFSIKLIEEYQFLVDKQVTIAKFLASEKFECLDVDTRHSVVRESVYNDDKITTIIELINCLHNKSIGRN